MHVFHAVVESDGMPGSADAASGFDAGKRLGNLLAGRRNQGLRVLEFAVRGPTSPGEAEAVVQQWLDRRIVPDMQK